MEHESVPNRERLRDWAEDEKLRARVKQAYAAAECERLRRQLAALRGAVDRLTTGPRSGDSVSGVLHGARTLEELSRHQEETTADLGAAQEQLRETAAQATAASQQALGLERLVAEQARQQQEAQQRGEQQQQDEYGARTAVKRE